MRAQSLTLGLGLQDLLIHRLGVLFESAARIRAKIEHVAARIILDADRDRALKRSQLVHEIRRREIGGDQIGVSGGDENAERAIGGARILDVVDHPGIALVRRARTEIPFRAHVAIEQVIAGVRFIAKLVLRILDEGRRP